jgi:hypothetical protein
MTRSADGSEVTDMKWLIALLLGTANGLVWVFILACLFRPQVWMALGPIVGSILALKGAAP